MIASFDLRRQPRRLALAVFLAACSALAMAQPPAPKAADKAKVDEKSKPLSKEAVAADIKTAKNDFLAGKFGEESMKTLKRAVEADPLQGTARTLLSQWFREARKLDDARAQLELAAMETPDNPEVYLVNAQYGFFENRTTDTILNLERVQELALNSKWTPEQRKHFNDEALTGLSFAYERRGDWSKVKRYLQDLDHANPGNPQTLVRLAKANFLVDLPDDAAKNFMTAFEKDPKMDPPELLMAQMWINRTATGPDPKKIEEQAAKNRAKAGEWFKKALEKYEATAALAKGPLERERAAKCYRGYAEWLLREGNLADARKLIDAAAKLEPDARETQALQGLLRRHEGKPAEAVKFFEAALSKSPSYAFAMEHLALALADSSDARDRVRSRDWAEQFRKQDPKNPEGYAVLGYCYLKQDPPMVDDADKVLAIPPRAGPISADTGYFIAILLDKRHKYDETAALLDKVLQENPHFIYRAEAEKLLKEVKPKAKKDTPAPAPKK